jgi:hypothetical protein
MALLVSLSTASKLRCTVGSSPQQKRASLHWMTNWREGARPIVAVHTPVRISRSSQNTKSVLGIDALGSGVFVQVVSPLVSGNCSMPLELMPTVPTDAL